MKVIGLTGGIGSGKTTLLRWFEKQGIPCFESDAVGKQLLNSDLKEHIISHFGEQYILPSGQVDTKKLGALVFNKEEALKQLNAIVHPAVTIEFEKFKKQHKKSILIVKEAAILFESGGDVDCNAVIYVSASEEARIQRVMQRDQVSKEAVIKRMQHQWSDQKKRELADYIIENEYIDEAYQQAEKIKTSLKKSN